ncbi:DUF4865 family protein [Streptomyces catenulae]|uniref:DUF4865 family protein n=1 Tax=Streptomyces catenulae TaxID=66875 RepID=A0ABV2YWC7_9ACTN|nr:DUF4865 family protein [Streptomyces catenulae]
MYAMQYARTLPADYDMEIIRNRVRTRGHLLDDFDGLGLKAYGMRVRGIDGSPVNAYAPFYLWADPRAMNRFLAGDGFRGVIRDFGRPPVRHWQGLFHRAGPEVGTVPRAYTLRSVRLPEGADPGTAFAEAAAGHEQLARTSGVHTTAMAYSPADWEIVHVTLWTGEAPEDAGDRYQVLHLSAPDIGALGEGRLW